MSCEQVRPPLLRGLRVRVAIVSGRVDDIKVNKTSGRREYVGDLNNQLEALISSGHGGQILMSQSVYDSISSMLPMLAVLVNSQPSFKALAHLHNTQGPRNSASNTYASKIVTLPCNPLISVPPPPWGTHIHSLSTHLRTLHSMTKATLEPSVRNTANLSGPSGLQGFCRWLADARVSNVWSAVIALLQCR